MPTQAIFVVGGELDPVRRQQVHYSVNLYELDLDGAVVGLPIEVATAQVPVAILHDGDQTLVHAIFALRSICYQLEIKHGEILESASRIIPDQLTIDDVTDNK